MKTADLKARLQEHVPLAQYSTLGIGGPARYFIDAVDEESVITAARWCDENKIPLFVLGGGSNILIADEGYAGLVLHINNRGIESHLENGKIIVSAAAGEDWDQFVATAVANDWGGLECLSGIPGKIGATPIQNVGAYGQEVKNSITVARVYDRHQDQIVTLSNSECRFGYRESIFKNNAKDRYIVLGVTYCLTPAGPPAIDYPELQKYLADNASPTLAETRAAVLAIRKRKSMVLDAQDIDARSVGSFFVNPIVSAQEFEQLVDELRANGELGAQAMPPHFPADDGKVKLSAAWLIEQAGFNKGFQHGNVGISSKHALAIINRGGGRAREVIELAQMIQARLQEKYRVALAREPVYVGL
jgi:UDP-N-acetylmuramate dehydrogenase